MLRLFLAWRLLQMLSPRLLFRFAALALTAALQAAPRTTERGQMSLTHLAQGVKRTVNSLVADARHVLTGPRP